MIKPLLNFTAGFFVLICNISVQAGCLPSDDFVPSCRYKQGDSWCKKHGKGNRYAYDDKCIKKFNNSPQNNSYKNNTNNQNANVSAPQEKEKAPLASGDDKKLSGSNFAETSKNSELIFAFFIDFILLFVTIFILIKGLKAVKILFLTIIALVVFGFTIKFATGFWLAILSAVFLLILVRKYKKTKNILINKSLNSTNELKTDIIGMSPIQYEQYCAKILNHTGWRARTTVASGDQGADVFAEKNGIIVVIQCKLYYSANVGNKAVQEVYAAKGFYNAHKAFVVSNASYTNSACQLASKLGVFLIHHDDLNRLDSLLVSSAS